MAYDIEKVKQKLDKSFFDVKKYSPITAIVKKGRKDLYDIIFSSKDGIIRHVEDELNPRESFDLANEATKYLKDKGYACTVNLTALPLEVKNEIIGLG